MYSIKVTKASIVLLFVFMGGTCLFTLFGAVSWDDFWAMMFIYVLMIIYLVFSIWWNRYKEKRTSRKSIESARTDERGYFFLLRSFNERELYETHGGYLDPEYRIPAGTTTIFSSLDKAIADFGNLIILRTPKLEHEFDSTEYYWKALIADGGKDWKSAYRYLAKHSRAILLIPSTSKGSLYEIRTIRKKNMWHKTIVFMPPVHFKLGLWKYNASSDVKTEVGNEKHAAWEQIRKDLLIEDFHLPEYDHRGCLYLPNSDLSINQGYYLPEEKTEELRIQQGLTEVLKLKAFHGSPTRQIFNRFSFLDAMLVWPES